MLSLIEVQCPHCGAKGQIMIPLVGSMIIGPCPQCDELVVVFCGHVLPLDKQLMEEGDIEEKRSHLLTALTGFLHERVGRLLLGKDSEDYDTSDEEEVASPQDFTPDQPTPISDREHERFTKFQLKRLDNVEYFRRHFGANKP